MFLSIQLMPHACLPRISIPLAISLRVLTVMGLPPVLYAPAIPHMILAFLVWLPVPGRYEPGTFPEVCRIVVLVVRPRIHDVSGV